MNRPTPNDNNNNNSQRDRQHSADFEEGYAAALRQRRYDACPPCLSFPRSRPRVVAAGWLRACLAADTLWHPETQFQFLVYNTPEPSFNLFSSWEAKQEEAGVYQHAPPWCGSAVSRAAWRCFCGGGYGLS